jgi:proteasome accessory factor B
MMRIHELLKAGRFPNAVGLAKEMEMATRTIKRDIDFMRDRLRLPIEYDEIRHGYSYSRPVDRFPSVAITEEELFVLLVADKVIAQYHGTPFQRPLRQAFAKLAGQLDGQTSYSLENHAEGLSFRPAGPEEADLHAFELVTRALQRGVALRFKYRKLGTRRHEERLVHPYHLACIDSHWYLFGHDTKRCAIRTFALSRLRDPKLTEDRFEKPANFDPDEYLRGSFGVMKGDKLCLVAVEFDAWATDLVRGRQWHWSQQFNERPDGTSMLKMQLNSLEEVERWVLSWGKHATVVGPKELAKRVAQSAKDISAKY